MRMSAMSKNEVKLSTQKTIINWVDIASLTNLTTFWTLTSPLCQLKTEEGALS